MVMKRLCFAVCGLLVLMGCKPSPASSPVSPTPAAASGAPAAQTPPAPVAEPAAPPAALPAVRAALTEREKIDALLTRLEASSDTFTRNGSDYSGKDAAAHLRSKWKSAGDRVKTARQFIDGLASTSSMSGKPYTVRKADGSTVNAKAWFDAELAEIETRVQP